MSSRSTTSCENTIVNTPMMQRMMLMNRAKLSAWTTPKLCASVFQRKYDAAAAPTRPIRPSPAIGMRSPGCRNASASMAAVADKTTIRIGMMAAKLFIGSLTHAGMRDARCGVRDAGCEVRNGDDGAGGRRQRVVDSIHRAHHGGLHRPEEHAREDAHRDGSRDGRNHDRPLARREIGKAPVLFVGDLAVVHPLEHPQHVDGRKDDTSRRDRGKPGVPPERAEED